MPTIVGRALARGVAGLFAVSSAFPLAAGLSKDTASFPKWWGVADVAIAGCLAVLACAVAGGGDKKISPRGVDLSYRAYRILTQGLLVIIGAFLLRCVHIFWINSLPGSPS